jgi:lipopolysaccharide biosynthesis protein
MSSLADSWRRWRRAIKAGAPYVRRRQYRILERKYAGLIDALHTSATPAGEAPLEVRKPVSPDLDGEVCLFVTHAPQAHLKTHVVHHVRHLLRAGLKVVLIVNTDLPLAEVQVETGLEADLSGVLLRANRGYDFGAWAHVLSLCDSGAWQRLYFVNDSIVGPLDGGSFDLMMERVRASDADLVGLTENHSPMRHVQSYFLVFNRRAMASDAFGKLMRGVLNFPDKGQVVDVYELRFTQLLAAQGLRATALFPDPDEDAASGDLLGRWEPMLAAGFPYVKTRVLQELAGDARMQPIRTAACVDEQI